MSGFVAEVDANAAAAKAEADAGGNGTFPPLAPGKYQAVVGEIKGVKPFGGTGANSQKKVVSLSVKIIADSPQGKNRVFWVRIPLFTRFAPTEKNPAGATARGYWDFWGKAMGAAEADLIAGRLPGEEIVGRQLTITLGPVLPPDQYNPLGFNEVSFYDKAGDVSATPSAPPVVAWLDADLNVIPSAIPGYAGPVAAPGAPAAPPAYAQPPAYAAPPAPSAPAAPVADASTPPAWQPDAADVAAAQALAETPVPADASSLDPVTGQQVF